MPKLTWPGGSKQIQGSPLLVGRDPVACDVALEEDSLLSRLHFALVPGTDGTVLLDLRSSNGTYVNEARVHYSRLRDGDTIQAGSGKFEYQDDARAAGDVSILREPSVAFLARSSRDPYVGFLRTLAGAEDCDAALQAAVEGLRAAAQDDGLPGAAAFALEFEGSDPVRRATSGAPPEAMAGLLGPLVARFQDLDRPFLVESLRRDRGFLPEGYPIRVEAVGGVAAAPLGRDGRSGLLCLVTTEPAADLAAGHVVMVEAFAVPLAMAMDRLGGERMSV